jgi:membrane protein YdbS with pleckstrin-like domain
VFDAYVENPQNHRFEGQDVDEKILLLLRAHPVTNLSWVIPAILLFLAPLFIGALTPLLNIDLSNIPSSLGLVFLLINYLLVSVIIFEGFLHWYFNVYIITSKNVIDVDFHSVLFKNIDMAPLRNIEDTSSSMAGLLNSIFNYGNVIVQTAGSSKNIEFTSVPKPHQVADFILDHLHRIHGKVKDAHTS